MTLQIVQRTDVSQVASPSHDRGGDNRRVRFAHAITCKAPVPAAPRLSLSLARLLNAMHKAERFASMAVLQHFAVDGSCEQNRSDATDRDKLDDTSILKKKGGAQPSPGTSKNYTVEIGTGLYLGAHEAWRLLDGLDMVEGAKKAHTDKVRKIAIHMQRAGKCIGLDKLARQLGYGLCSVKLNAGYEDALNRYWGACVIAGTDRDGKSKAILCRYEMRRSARRWQAHQGDPQHPVYVELGKGWESYHYDGKEMKKFEEFKYGPGDIAARFRESRVIIPHDDLTLLDTALRSYRA